jgi:hypothetical protein
MAQGTVPVDRLDMDVSQSADTSVVPRDEHSGSGSLPAHRKFLLACLLPLEFGHVIAACLENGEELWDDSTLR